MTITLHPASYHIPGKTEQLLLPSTKPIASLGHNWLQATRHASDEWVKLCSLQWRPQLGIAVAVKRVQVESNARVLIVQVIILCIVRCKFTIQSQPPSSSLIIIVIIITIYLPDGSAEQHWILRYDGYPRPQCVQSHLRYIHSIDGDATRVHLTEAKNCTEYRTI